MSEIYCRIICLFLFASLLVCSCEKSTAASDGALAKIIKFNNEKDWNSLQLLNGEKVVVVGTLVREKTGIYIDCEGNTGCKFKLDDSAGWESEAVGRRMEVEGVVHISIMGHD